MTAHNMPTETRRSKLASSSLAIATVTFEARWKMMCDQLTLCRSHRKRLPTIKRNLPVRPVWSCNRYRKRHRNSNKFRPTLDAEQTLMQRRSSTLSLFLWPKQKFIESAYATLFHSIVGCLMLMLVGKFTSAQVCLCVLWARAQRRNVILTGATNDFRAADKPTN